MNVIERGRAFRARLQALAERTEWDWKRCPRCGGRWTIKYGSYTRYPWSLEGRLTVRVQRHLCYDCTRTYSEQSPLLVRGSWYCREVHRAAIDSWQHMGTSLRRAAEYLRSWMGRQERWSLWRPLDPPPGERCHLSASTVHRWLDEAGEEAVASIADQLAEIGEPQVLGTDGLWAKLKGGVVRVVLLVVDSVSGLIFPPVVAAGEESAGPWQQLFARAREAGMDLQRLRGLTSDGAQGLLAYLRRELAWVEQQRCIWHLWRGLGSELASAVSRGVQTLCEEAADEVRKALYTELGQLIHSIVDARYPARAEAALQKLLAHPQGAALGKYLTNLMDRVLVYQMAYCRGLPRVSPEWYWRDFRLRLSHGRNHRSEQRLERAALLWAVYHNFEPAQRRSERKRHYRHPGQSALQVAGAPPGPVSYLDALGV